MPQPEGVQLKAPAANGSGGGFPTGLPSHFGDPLRFPGAGSNHDDTALETQTERVSGNLFDHILRSALMIDSFVFKTGPLLGDNGLGPDRWP